MIKNLDVTQKEEGIIVVTVTIDKDSLQPFYQKSLQKVQSESKMKGFRPGKAPLNLIKQIYSSQINYETINALFPVLYQKIEKEHNIKAMSTPELSGLDNFNVDEDFTLEMTIETMPEVTNIPDLSSINIKKVSFTTDDESLITKELETLQDLKSEYKDIKDETIQENNFVKASVVFDNQSENPDDTQYFNIKKSDPNYEISSHFIGKTIGNSYNEEISFSESFHLKEFAGKTLPVKFTLIEGKHTEKPPVDDDLAKLFGFESLENMKKSIKNTLQIRASMREYFTNVDLIFQEIIKQASFSISKKIVKNQAQNELQALFQKIMSSTTLEDYLKQENLTDDGLIQKTENDARISIEKHLVSEHLKETLNISSTEKELDEFIKDIASQEVANQKEIVKYYNQNPQRKESLKIQLDLKKLALALLEKVTISGTEKKSLSEEK